MANKANGVVREIFIKKYGNLKLYSFVLEDDDNYYGTGRDKPSIQEGNEVEFEWDKNDKGYPAVNIETLKVVGSSEKKDTSEPKKTKSLAGSKDSYWDWKKSFDIENQRRISYQAATNTALALVSKALDQDVISLGSKKDEKLGNFMGYVEEIAGAFFVQYQFAGEEQFHLDLLKSQEKVTAVDKRSTPSKRKAVEEGADPELNDDVPF